MSTSSVKQYLVPHKVCNTYIFYKCFCIECHVRFSSWVRPSNAIQDHVPKISEKIKVKTIFISVNYYKKLLRVLMSAKACA